MIRIKYNPDILAELCRKWRIRKLSLFGSAVRDDFRPDSDVDVALSFDENSHWSLLDIVDIKEEFARLFGREVDIVEIEAITNPIRREIILGSMQTVYEG